MAKLSAAGNVLQYSTYLGGSGYDWAHGIAVDVVGSAYLTGETNSTDFPTQNPYDDIYNAGQGASDAFVAKISPQGSALSYSTYLGGTGEDYGFGIAVDASGNAYVTGQTQSSDFPTFNAFDASNSDDAFVTKLSTAGDALIYSTFLGGTATDVGYGIAVDGSGCAYVTGYTGSTNFPTQNAFDDSFSGLPAFVTKLSATGNALVYSTYLGESHVNVGYGIAVDAGGSAYVTGVTTSPNFPTLNAFDASYGGGSGDGFVTQFSESGNQLVYSTFLGTNGFDLCRAIAVDGSRSAYVAGQTSSSFFPMVNPYDGSYNGWDSDAIVAKFLPGPEQCGDLGFRPDPEGWQFGNMTANMWPQSWWQQFDYGILSGYPFQFWTAGPSDFPDWPLFVRAFGEYSCYWDPPPGLVFFKPSAVSRWKGLKHKWGGSCFGFSTSAFLFYDQFLSVSGAFPGNATLHDVPISDSSRLLVNKFQIYQFGLSHYQYILSRYEFKLPSETLYDCQAMFQTSASNDRVLMLFNNHGTGGHAVNPYRCEQDGQDPDLHYIYVYDNAHPNVDTMRVVVDLGQNSWTYSGIEPEWGGARRLFLAEPVAAYTTPPTGTSSLLPRDQWIGEKSAASGYMEVYLSERDSVSLVSSLGSIGQVGDSLFSELTDGMPITPITGQETPPIGYFLPIADWTIAMCVGSGDEARVSVLCDSSHLTYTRSSASAENREELRCQNSGTAFVLFNSGPDAIEYDLESIAIHPDSEIVCVISGIGTGLNDSVLCSMTDESGLEIRNYGAATSYNVRVEIANAQANSVFAHADLSLAENTVHQIVPDWRATGDSLIVLVDSGTTGSFTDTLRLENQSGVICACDCHADPAGCNGVQDITDVVQIVNVAFRGNAAITDPSPSCPYERTDVNCTNSTDVLDVVKMVNVAFRGANVATEFCNPCP